MKLIRGLHNLQRTRDAGVRLLAAGCVASIGNFDGIHLGHQAIIQQVRQQASRLGLPSLVIVFEPQPREFFEGDAAPARLTRFRDKLEALDRCGLDWVLCLPFNARLRSLSASAFIEQVLMDGARVRHLVVGDDFRFGCDRRGDFAALVQAGTLAGFTVERTLTVELDGDRISSTRIRALLAANALDAAARLCGRPYSISGKVVHGRKLGRELGVPTANVSLGGRKPPLKGVYLVVARLEDGVCLSGVANIGVRPTVDGVMPSLEVHLLAFSGELYACRLTVVFLAPLRDEQKFESLPALKARIHADVQQARVWHAQHPDPLAGWTLPDHATIPINHLE